MILQNFINSKCSNGGKSQCYCIHTKRVCGCRPKSTVRSDAYTNIFGIPMNGVKLMVDHVILNGVSVLQPEDDFYIYIYIYVDGPRDNTN